MTEIEWIQDEIRMETEFPKLVTTTDHNITTTLDDISYRYDWNEISVITFCFAFPFLFAMYAGSYSIIEMSSEPEITFINICLVAFISFITECFVLVMLGDIE